MTSILKLTRAFITGTEQPVLKMEKSLVKNCYRKLEIEYYYESIKKAFMEVRSELPSGTKYEVTKIDVGSSEGIIEKVRKSTVTLQARKRFSFLKPSEKRPVKTAELTQYSQSIDSFYSQFYPKEISKTEIDNGFKVVHKRFGGSWCWSHHHHYQEKNNFRNEIRKRGYVRIHK